jgi:hypothetical protein
MMASDRVAHRVPASIPALEFVKLAGAYSTFSAYDFLSFLPTVGYEARWI